MAGTTGTPPRAHTRAVPRWTGAFLEALQATARVTQACRAAGVPRRTAYNLRGRDPDFAEAWDDAVEHAIELLEREAYRRAIEGSDRLIMFLLKALRPEKYVERYQVRRAPAGPPPTVDFMTNPKLQKAAAGSRRAIAATRTEGEE